MNPSEVSEWRGWACWLPYININTRMTTTSSMSHLSCGYYYSVRMKSQSYHIIWMIHEVFLLFALSVHHHSQCCSRVDYISWSCVFQRITRIERTISMHILKRQILRWSSMSTRWHFESFWSWFVHLSFVRSHCHELISFLLFDWEEFSCQFSCIFFILL